MKRKLFCVASVARGQDDRRHLLEHRVAQHLRQVQRRRVQREVPLAAVARAAGAPSTAPSSARPRRAAGRRAARSAIAPMRFARAPQLHQLRLQPLLELLVRLHPLAQLLHPRQQPRQVVQQGAQRVVQPQHPDGVRVEVVLQPHDRLAPREHVVEEARRRPPPARARPPATGCSVSSIEVQRALGVRSFLTAAMALRKRGQQALAARLQPPQRAEDAAARDGGAQVAGGRLFQVVRLVQDEAAVVRQHGRRRVVALQPADGQVAEEQVVVHDEDVRLRRVAPRLLVEAVLEVGALGAQAHVRLALHLVPHLARWGGRGGRSGSRRASSRSSPGCRAAPPASPAPAAWPRSPWPAARGGWRRSCCAPSPARSGRARPGRGAAAAGPCRPAAPAG